MSSQSFADVPITDAGVDTVSFLEAADGLVGLFGMEVLSLKIEIAPLTFLELLGSAAFSVVQNDLKGNIAVRPHSAISARTTSF